MLICINKFDWLRKKYAPVPLENKRDSYYVYVVRYCQKKRVTVCHMVSYMQCYYLCMGWGMHMCFICKGQELVC